MSLLVRAAVLMGLAFVWQGMAMAQTAATIGIYQPPGASAQQLVDLLAAEGYAVRLLGSADLAKLPESGLSALVLPPQTRFPAEARDALAKYLAKAGSLAVLEPHAFDYAPACLDPVQLVDFTPPQKGYFIQRPGGTRPTITYIDAPGTSDKAIHIYTPHIGAGDVYVDIPLTQFRAANRSVLSFRAKGDYETEILFLRIVDRSGGEWVAFVDLSRSWRSYKVSMADFMPVDAKKQAAGALLNPADAMRLHIGMDSAVLWTELAGSFALGAVYLGEPAASDVYTPTSETLKWQASYARNKTKMPAYVFDPFLDTQELADVRQVVAGPGQAIVKQSFAAGDYRWWSIPYVPHARGREEANITDILPNEDVRRIPLLTAVDQDGRQLGNVAELHLHNGGPFKNAQVALLGVEGAEYAPGSDMGKLLLAAVDYMVAQPKIARVTPTLSSRYITHLEARVLIANPLNHAVTAQVSVQAGDGLMKAERTINLPARAKMEHAFDLGEVPANFPMTDFAWTVSLTTEHGNDVMADRVNVEEQLIRSAQHMIKLQNEHADGRISFYFFGDVYGMRVMYALGQYLQKPEAALRNQSILGETKASDFTAAALRFADMIARRQKPNGAIPIGYFENRDFSYIADVGTIALGLLQMASWMDSEHAQRYLDVVRKYMDLRQTFYIDAELSARLEAKYGKGHAGTKQGSYGLGFLDFDYYTNEKWGELRRHEAGPAWVLTITMGVPAGMSVLDSNPKYKEIATMDAEQFIKSGYTAEGYFQSECTFWLYYTLADPQLRSALLKVFKQTALPAIVNAKPNDWLENGGRAPLRWLAPTYYRNFIEDTPMLRAAFVKALWGMCSDSSAYSLEHTRRKYPHSTYGPSADAARYVTMSAIWFMEMLEPGSTLLKDVPLSPLPPIQ